MMVYVGLGGFAGVVVFGVLYVLFFLKGGSLKLPIIGMVACLLVVAASSVLLKLMPGEEDAPDDGAEPTETVQAEPQGGDDMVAEQVLLDKRGIVITATGLEQDGTFGPGLKLLIENNSEEAVTVQARNVSVNGYMVDASLSVDVPAGKKANDSLTLLASSLQKCGIETIADMEFYFHLIGANLSTFLDSDVVKVTTAAADTYQYGFDDSGEELYSGNGVRMVSKGFSEDDSIFGPGLMLFVENTTDQAITVQARDVSVNGYMVDAIFSEDISAGKRTVTAITVMDSSLEENKINEIREMEFYFHVVKTDGLEPLFDTDPVTVRPN